ncbi:triple tyrosine motif-containing protein [Marivirga aurantiaca]|uniref:triple tyrosine motif-containing protein n=1 Tax=Marivirga aurantiaca TaxID=2802615 RepID=UPI001F36F8DF|nr:triple tyrosine motif-containing protein [Marivirga aurantiaca]
MPFSKYYSSQDYVGGIQNWKITQSSEGLIYVANNFGLLEFDGTHWERYTLERGTKCRYVFINADGKIYVSGQGDFGYFIPNQNGIFEFISLANKLPASKRNFDETWRIYERNDEVIFCTFEDIFIFNQKDEFVKNIDPEYDPESFHMVNHEVYVNQLETGLSVMGEDSLQLINGGEFFKNKTITSILPIANDQLLICTYNEGIYISSSQGFTEWSQQNKSFLQKAAINQAIRLNNGNIAIGTQNEGVAILNAKGDIDLHLNKGKGIENRTVLSLFEDIQGNLWLGHNNGISMIELNLPFTHANEQIELPGTGYDALLKNDTLYYGTNNGLYYKDIQRTDSRLYLVENSIGQVYSISNIGGETIMGHHNGAYSIRNGKAHLIAPIAGTWTFLELKNFPEYVLQGNYKGLALFKKTSKGLRFVRKLKGFNESSRVMQQDQDGYIWMTHGYKGVYRINLDDDLHSVTFKYYGIESGLPSTLLINVWRVNNRLIFTTEHGVYQYDKKSDRFIEDDYFNSLLGDDSQIMSLSEDPIGNVFYASMTDIGVLEKQSNRTYEKHTDIFNRLNLLLNDDLQNLITLEANQVLFAAKEGFIHFNNQLQKSVNHNFSALINKIQLTTSNDSLILKGRYIKDQKIQFTQPKEEIPEISFKNNAIHFSFSAPFVEGQNNTQYQYWLENLEEGYSEWSNRMVKEYTNLKEGKYTFHVQAKNIYNQISNPATFTFIISPPWYRTKVAYTIYFGLSIALLFVIFYAFEFHYKKKTEVLTEEKEKEINRIDSELKSSEQEIERLKNEKLKAKIEIQNKELATSTMHLINKNGFISHVKTNLNAIIKRSKNQEVQHEINKIIHNIDKNIASDNDWEHFSIHFDQVHGDFIKRLKDNYPNLSPQEMKLSAYLRMNLSTKEIAHLLNISVRGVEIARYRLRKKLILERAENLQEFILKY